MFGHQNGGDALLTLDGQENAVKVSACNFIQTGNFIQITLLNSKWTMESSENNLEVLCFVLFSDHRADGPVWRHVHSTRHSLSYGNDPTAGVSKVRPGDEFQTALSFSLNSLSLNTLHVARYT